MAGASDQRATTSHTGSSGTARERAALASAAAGVPEEEARLLAALRRGDETAFMSLVERYQGMLLRLARAYVDAAAAEEVVQETWLAVLQGLSRFEGRSALKTWIFRILVNRAKTRAERDGRLVPFSALALDDADDDEPAVAPERFWPSDSQSAGGWVSLPRGWDHVPESVALSRELYAVIARAIEALPAQQATVIRLRDVEGCSSDEACNVLGISETNQRVLLHRARARVRQVLEDYYDEERSQP
jgi:RNA polymerase sigma-70 factor, ECF subfamily